MGGWSATDQANSVYEDMIVNMWTFFRNFGNADASYRFVFPTFRINGSLPKRFFNKMIYQDENADILYGVNELFSRYAPCRLPRENCVQVAAVQLVMESLPEFEIPVEGHCYLLTQKHASELEEGW